MADHEDDRYMPEKTVEWLQDDALRQQFANYVEANSITE
jgi:hypothetical protein